MVHFRLLLLLIPAVSCSDLLHFHKKPPLPGRVRQLRANETVNPSGSDVLFSWEECAICDGYDVRLYLENVAGKREIQYTLKSAVTALKITDLLPRTLYRLVVRKLPSDSSSSEISGRCFAPKAPLPIENLVARPLTSSSIHLEWDSWDADGFVVQVLENGTIVQEKLISDFNNRSSVIVENLNPKTVYKVQVAAFFSPHTEESRSTVTDAVVETLPIVLPVLRLSWEQKTKLKLFWTNPRDPTPVKHSLACTKGETTIFDAELSGLTDFVALSSIDRTEEILCTLRTWFSTDQRTRVETRMSIQKEEEKPLASYSQNLWCGDGYPISYSANANLERIGETEWVAVKFSESHSDYLVFRELQYRLCEATKTCDGSWISLPSGEYPQLLLKPGTIKPWARYTLQYRFLLRCYYDSYGPRYTTMRTLELPSIAGSVSPVSELFATKSTLTWGYDSSVFPDYFLVTYCAGMRCTSQSVPGGERSVSLGHLDESLIYDATIQAVVLHDGQVHISPTEMTSIVAPNFKFSENVTMEVEEIVDSPEVKLVIAHNTSADAPPPVEYHVEICSRPVRIWDEDETAELLGSNTTCRNFVSPVSAVEFIRKPWISYNVSVLICYGAFHSNEPVNKTLPVFKQIPRLESASAVEELPLGFSISWNYEPTPSGFRIRICPWSIDSGTECYESEAGPMDRSFVPDYKRLPAGACTIFLSPFVKFEGSVFNGTEGDFLVPDCRGPTAPEFPSNIR